MVRLTRRAAARLARLVQHAGASHTEALHLANRVSTNTPQALRALCRERYGWYDHCGTCAVPARECGQNP